MTIYTSNKAYYVREPFSIVVPGIASYTVGLKKHVMFHNDKNKTKDCKDRDIAGNCTGHTMSRREFLDEFCGGVLPPELVKS